MATFSYVIPYHKEDGTANVRIRIVHNRKKKEFSTNIILQPTDITKGGRIKNYRVLDSLEDLLSTYRKKITELGLKANDMNVEEIYSYIMKPDSIDIDFKEYVVELSKKKKYNTARTYITAINQLCNYIGGEHIFIGILSRKLIQDFVNDMADKHNNNTAITYFKKLKACFNCLLSEYNSENEEAIKKNPFSRITLPKATITQKKAIDIDMLRKILSIKGKAGSLLQFISDMYALSFYLVGMNMIDLYNCKKSSGGYITYNRTKVKDRRSDMAEITIKIPEVAMPIIERNIDSSGNYLLNLHDRFANAQTLAKVVTQSMKLLDKEIGQHITFYSARHSWATIAYNNCNIDKYTIHLALNHIDNTMTITDTYIKKDFTKIDTANEKVISYVLKL